MTDRKSLLYLVLFSFVLSITTFSLNFVIAGTNEQWIVCGTAAECDVKEGKVCTQGGGSWGWDSPSTYNPDRCEGNSDGNYCNVAIKETRDYKCSATQTCEYTVSSSEDCSTKASEDIGDSGYDITNAGKCRDYTSCSAGACTYVDTSDSCSGDTLTEYYADVASCASDTVNCATKRSTDSDAGDDPFGSGTVTDYTTCSGSSCGTTTYRDSCSSNVLTEYYPSGSSYSSSTYECKKYGQTCSDTDNAADDYTTKGTVSGKDSTGCTSTNRQCTQSDYSKTDSCSSGKLIEYGCPVDPSAQDQPYIQSSPVDCAATFGTGYTCSNGMCVPPPCGGSAVLSLSPSSAEISSSVTPSVSGLTTCSNRQVSFKLDSCSGTQVSSCTIDGASGCTGATFNAPSTPGIYNYYVCVDKNSDNDYSDSGESDSETLKVTPCIPTKAIIQSVTPQGLILLPSLGFDIEATIVDNCNSPLTTGTVQYLVVPKPIGTVIDCTTQDYTSAPTLDFRDGAWKKTGVTAPGIVGIYTVCVKAQ